MLNSIRRFFTAPVFEGDEEKTRTAGVLNIILYSLILLLVFVNAALVIISLVAHQPPPNPLVSVMATMVFIGLIIFMRLGFVGQVSLVLAFVVSGVITFSLSRSTTLVSVTTTGYMIAVIIAGILSGGGSALIVALFSVFSLGVLNYLATHGFTQVQPLTTSNLITLGALFSMAALLLGVTSRSLKEALAKARQNELAQLKANQELVGLQATLEQHVAERTKALETSAEVSRSLTAILDPRQLAGEVVNQVKTAFDYYHAQIFLFDEAGENLVTVAGTGAAGAEMLQRGHSIAKGRGVVGRAAETNQPVLVSDTSQDPDWLPNPSLPDTKAEAAIPIAIGDQVLGVLDVQDAVTNNINSSAITLLQSLASQVAIALQNARQYTETKVLLHELGETQSFLDSVFENLPTMLFVKDAGDLRFMRWNKAAEEVSGFQREDLIGKNDYDFFPKEEADFFTGKDRQVLANGQLLDIPEEPLATAHQGVRYLHTRKVPIYGADGIVKYLLGVSEDITERKRSDELTRQHAQQQEALNLITQKIQNATTIESALQITARELGRALGMKPTLVTLEPDGTNSDRKSDIKHKEG